MRNLHVIETAFRATLEEQDDPAIWVVHALARAGSNVAVLLRASAVVYGSTDLDARGLSFGALRQQHPPDLAGDVARLIDSGVEVHYVEDDLVARGMVASEVLSGLRPVGRGDLPELFEQFDRIWHW